MKSSVLFPLALSLLVACPCPPEKPVNPPTPVQAEPDAGVVVVPPDAAPPPPKSAAELYTEKCDAEIAKSEKLLSEILAVEGPRTVENTLEPYNVIGLTLYNASESADLYQMTNPDEAMREAARACQQKANKLASALSVNRELYQAFSSVDVSQADAETQRFVDHTLRDFRRSGVDKDDATRKRLEEIDDELTTLAQQWQKNIADDVRHITLKSADQLKGMPADYIAAHAPDENGEIHITTDYPDFIPFLTYADSTELRKELYVKFNQRAPANAAVLKHIIELRDEKAHTLGFDNWADYITADKMMKSGKNASAFIDRVVRIARKRANKDYRTLLQRKRKDQRGAKRLESYESSYYETKILSEKYKLDPLAVREYFVYDQVEKALLDITSKIFDVTYVRVKNAEVWHESVKVFDVMRGDTKLGRFYLDMHPRANKYKHAANFTIARGVEGLTLPVGALVCNLPDPEKTDGPALLEHDDVVTMFHEFGHLMHNILGGHHRWFTQSGIATEWDFVEVPSQVFEEWAWNYDTLKLFARNYKTGEPIPKDLVERMRRAKEFGLGLQTIQQMFYARMSLNFYTIAPAKLDLQKECDRLQTKLTPFRTIAGTNRFTSFGHLNHYSAMYYTYMWSLVIAKDLAATLLKHGLMNTDWTYRYRDAILVPGGTKDAADLVKDFLGRPFNYKAFEKYLGG